MNAALLLTLALLVGPCGTGQFFSAINETSDHFKLLDFNNFSILIGARNTVYNISLNGMKENRGARIEWNSTSDHKEKCFQMGKTREECENYIRVAVQRPDGGYLVCGTNSFMPLCRSYYSTNGTVKYSQFDGRGRCPFDPTKSSTYVFVDGKLYSGTTADFQGNKPIIFRKPLATDYASTQLHAPIFVHSLEYEDVVLFFFRETALEYLKCGRRVYSRVARVCKNDRGGMRRLASTWTSFLKSKLECSVPGEFPFYFDEIQSASDVVGDIVYTAFTTPANSIPGSAICAFSIHDILETFNEFSCSSNLSNKNIRYMKKHSLVNKPVLALSGKPLIVKAQMRFIEIAVDLVVSSQNENTHVIFVATDTGKLLKIVDGSVVEIFEIFTTPVLINDLIVINGKLIAVSTNKVTAINRNIIHSSLIRNQSNKHGHSVNDRSHGNNLANGIHVTMFIAFIANSIPLALSPPTLSSPS